MEGAKSINSFRITFYLEFRCGTGAGQGQQRLSSGRYEVQMLDSSGLEGKSNECGGCTGLLHPVKTCVSLLLLGKPTASNSGRGFKDGQKEKRLDECDKWRSFTIIGLPKRTTASPLKEGPEPGSFMKIMEIQCGIETFGLSLYE